MSRESGLQTTVTDRTSQSGLYEAFAASLSKLALTPPFALAVSGGGDSAAMMHLIARWAQAHNIVAKTIHVLTVDHGLRAISRGEADQVGAWARALGFGHQTLVWEGGKPDAGVQAKARAARRELLCGWCREHQVPALLMAHTADDQAETVAMRLARDTGPFGLAGMSPNSEGPFGIRIARPLLGMTREALRTWLVNEDAIWIDDPSNDDTAFERVRVRNDLATDPARRERLLTLSFTAGALRDLAEDDADEVLRDTAVLHAAGWAKLNLERLRAAPEAAARHALQRILSALGGAAHPPHRESFDRLWAGLKAGDFKGATLSGCRIVPEAQNSALFGREARNLSPLALTARKWHLWDHRFEIRSAQPAQVLPLLAVGLDAFGGPDRERVKAAAPPVFREALPVVALPDGRLAVPHAGVSGEWELEVVFRALRPFGALAPGEAAGRV